MKPFSSARTRTGPQGITFAVDDVQPASRALPLSTLGNSFTLRSGRQIAYMADQDRPAVLPTGGRAGVDVDSKVRAEQQIEMLRSRRRPEGKPAQTFINPLIEAVHLAFSGHRPLILSPDAIWLTLAQGFARHTQEEADALRSRLVRHSGQKTLMCTTYELTAPAWERAVSSFSAQILDASDPVLHETLICDFSTTTPLIRTASELVLLDTYKRYFQYEVMCICGIPEITLTGTPEDWQRMRERIEVLATYDLEWWISSIRLILDEFVRAANGNPDRKFWKAIYKPEQIYGTEVATGWIGDLFPYLGDEPPRHRNRLLAPGKDWRTRVDKAPRGSRSMLSTDGIPPSAFPCGLSRVPVKVSTPVGPLGVVELMGGFFGVGQDAADNRLFPIISWAMANG